jgi:hypothetical protein
MIDLNRKALALLIGLSIPIGIVVFGLWALAKSVGL